jgi:hypothetical protein
MTLRRSSSFNSSVMTPLNEKKNAAAMRSDVDDDSDRKLVVVKSASR